jgi:hypothetical protein
VSSLFTISMSRFLASPIVAAFARGVAEQEVNLLYDGALEDVFGSGFVRDVYLQRDANSITSARKAMIRCGMALDATGQWHIQQLTPQLQAIIAKYRNRFDGEVVPEPTESTSTLHTALLAPLRAK